MVFYQDSSLLIRNMEPRDAQVLTDGERAQGWDADIGKFQKRLRDQEQGLCVSLAAEVDGGAVGYVNVYFDPRTGPFVDSGWPEIVDFGVLENYRRRGIGGKLMDAAERLAKERSDTVWLGVGLHSGYGSAQRMYVKRGYVPDGSGVWYQDRVCAPYGPCCNDDGLVLYLMKTL